MLIIIIIDENMMLFKNIASPKPIFTFPSEIDLRKLTSSDLISFPVQYVRLIYHINKTFKHT